MNNRRSKLQWIAPMWNLLRRKRKKVVTLRQYLKERERFRRFHPQQFAAEQAQAEQVVRRLVKFKQSVDSGKNRSA
jgi:hypothetical protein